MVLITSIELPVDGYSDINDVPDEVVAAARLCEAAGGNDIQRPTIDMVNCVLSDMEIASAFVARMSKNSPVLGLALYEPFDMKRDAPGNTSWIDALAVEKRARGLGIGAYMINHLVDVATDRNVDAIRLRSRSDEHTIRFYLKNGFDFEDDSNQTRMPVMRREI